MPIGDEVYIAITYDPLTNSARLYFDGALVASSSNVLNATSSFMDYTDWLGRSQWDHAPFFNGSFNEFRVWDGILTDQDITSHFAAGPDQQFVTTRPALSISAATNGVLLTWPADGTASLQLQTTYNLYAPSWVALTNTSTLSNGHYSVVLPFDAGSAFYRLAQ